MEPIKQETYNIINGQFTHLYIIAISVRENQAIYDRLNVSLKTTDNRGEAFYATTGAYRDIVAAAEQGFLLPEKIIEMHKAFLKEVVVIN